MNRLDGPYDIIYILLKARLKMWVEYVLLIDNHIKKNLLFFYTRSVLFYSERIFYYKAIGGHKSVLCVSLLCA